MHLDAFSLIATSGSTVPHPDSESAPNVSRVLSEKIPGVTHSVKA